MDNLLMRRGLLISVLSLLVTSIVAQSQSGAGVANKQVGNNGAPVTPVASSGETAVRGKVGKHTVVVFIKTHEVPIGQPTEARPPVIESNCTYSKYPCSIVDHVKILWNGRALFVPRSAFSDLADLGNAELEVSEKGSVLTLYGGDASESYIAKVEFNASRVKRRTLASGMSPSKPLQETIYYVVTLGD